MRKHTMLFIILGLLTNYKILGQDTIQQKSEKILYTFAINRVPDQYNFPLVGLINRAKGNHKSVQIGFLNSNQKNFTGTQLGLFNNVGGYYKGAQLGFINNVNDFFNGAQISLINNTNDFLTGAQISFINNTSDSLCGIQLGFINSDGDFIKGAQIGFANRTKIIKGFQLGFINFSDTVSNGLPMGFLSIVKNGGYMAFEMSLTDMYPINLSFKTGIKELYTLIIMSYNPDIEKKFALGFGVGTMIQLSQRINFYPELVSQSNFTKYNQQLISLSTYIGYSLTSRINILTGPAIIWEYTGSDIKLNEPFFSIYNYNFNNKNRLIVGFRIGLRYNISSM
jgi:hypothetical protein